ncbi:MAG: iron-sulfur cluster repair protein YtfE [Hahellaceae bacterium]|nr:iron-sulfur cluster repair protein YtfE [Hahellaceae bacterium]
MTATTQSTPLQNQTLAQLACDLPGATAIFHQYRLDFCCGGQKSLADAAQQKQIDLETLVAELQALQDDTGADTDWREHSASELIDHLLSRFHQRHRQQLPELIRLARRVEQVHGERPECPNGLADHLSHMAQELESHMMKEEQILFPLLRRNPVTMATGPISVMHHEHVQHGESIEQIDALTDNITPPPGACNTWRALYVGLQELKEDLMQHIHLENNVLFAGACKVRSSGNTCQCSCH